MYLDTTNIAPELSNLTHSEIEDLIYSYYKGKSFSLLLETYDITFPPKDLSTIFPLLLDEKHICDECKEPMARRHLSKITSKDKLSPPFCIECETKNKPNKSCEEVVEIQAIASKTNNSIINLCFKNNSLSSNNDPSLEVLSLKNLLYLILLKKSAKNFDHNTVYGLQENLRLLPFNNEQVLEYLIRKNIISLSPSTKNYALAIKNKKVTGLNIYEAHWKININPELPNVVEIVRFTNFIATDPTAAKNWREQINKMRLEIAIDECLEFFVVMSEKLGYPLTGALTQGQIKKCLLRILKKLPQSHCFKFIWMECKSNALGFYDFGLYHKDYCLINKFFQYSITFESQELLENAYKKGITRPIYCPRSKLNKLFFNEFLGFDTDKAFYVSPGNFLQNLDIEDKK